MLFRIGHVARIRSHLPGVRAGVEAAICAEVRTLVAVAMASQRQREL